jgi:predicted transcriptional regulator of viral defense system
MQKLISYRSSELLTGLSKAGKDFFSIRDAESILLQKKNSSVAKLLYDMAKRGLIMRIKDGVYHRIPYEQNAETYFPNWHLTAEAMAQPKEYYIGFYSALAIHGLITQPSLVEQVVTKEQMHPQNKLVKNVRFEFITLGEERFYGYSKTWIDDFHKVNCSDPEKTFIDCLYIPGHGGGITEIAKAFYKCREKINPERVQEYLEKFNVQAVNKRLGFMLEQLGLFPELRNYIAGKITSSYTPMDPSLPKKGNHYSRWKLIDNIDFRIVRHSLNT